MKGNKMETKRLKKLAEHLRTFKPNGRRFNMSRWFQVLDEPEEALSSTRKVDPLTGTITSKEQCRTAACALGEACLIPSFQKAGLRLESDGEQGGDDTFFTPRFGRHEGTVAGAKFFDISVNQAHWLFIPDQYTDRYGNILDKITPKMVSRRIDKLVAGKGPQ